MTSVIAKLVLVGIAVPAVVVFAIAYRYALRHWLRPVAPLPTASIATRRARFDRATVARHCHAAAIAAGFASVSIMVVTALGVVGVVVIGTL